MLSALAERGVGLLAFTAVPSGPELAQFALFPDDPNKLAAEARAAGLALDGPYHALLVQGDDVGSDRNFRIQVVPPRTGSYWVRVTAYPTTPRATYRLVWAPP